MCASERGRAAAIVAGVAIACALPGAAVPAETHDSALVAQESDAPLRLTVPVAGVRRASIRNTFADRRGVQVHEALDIPAARGTPVLAAAPGTVVKLFTSAAGGLTVYEFDPARRYALYYAHLDRYAAGVKEGKQVTRGEIIGYVGSTGNAAPDAPHLHFAVFRLGPGKEWWKGTAVDAFGWLSD
jgi:murein DD-endopeptidase MepM/ murein hydrolase activator NlpD